MLGLLGKVETVKERSGQLLPCTKPREGFVEALLGETMGARGPLRDVLRGCTVIDREATCLGGGPPCGSLAVSPFDQRQDCSARRLECGF